jgi:hypothetical protein
MQHIIPNVETFRQAVIGNADTRSKVEALFLAAGLSSKDLTWPQDSRRPLDK